MDFFQLSSFRAPWGRDAGGRVIAEGFQEVEIITAGRGYFDWEGRLWTATLGTVLWHVAGERTIYRNDPEDPYECLVAKFPWNPGAPRPAPRLSRWADPQACLDFTQEALTHYHGPRPDLGSLSAFVYATLVWRASQGGVDPGQGLRHPALTRALALVEERFHQDWGVADLARAAGVSAAHLYDLFRREGEGSPHQVLLQRRLSEARRLLAQTRLSVKEIAPLVGQPDVAVFCRTFKRLAGCTPTEYRDRHTQSEFS